MRSLVRPEISGISETAFLVWFHLLTLNISSFSRPCCLFEERKNMTWIGKKKIAFVPVFRPNAHPPDQIPTDWEKQILQRVLFDPNPTTGGDRSLRAYIHA